MIAEVTITCDLKAYGLEIIITLLIFAGLVFLLTHVVLDHSSISSGSGLPRKLTALPDSLSPENADRRQALFQLAERTALLDPANPAKGREKRSSLRREGNPVEVLVDGATALDQPIKGLVIDRSRGGLQLSLEQPVKVGSLLRVRPPTAPEDLPWVEILVRHCQARGDRWHLGCAFTEELPWSVLLLFG
jgi:PilZ domain